MRIPRHRSRAGLARWPTGARIAALAGLLLISGLGAATYSARVPGQGPGLSPDRLEPLANFTGSCTLLPGILTVLVSGSDNQTFQWNLTAPIGPSSNLTGPAFENLSLPPIYTVGEVRSAWSSICESPSYVETLQNVSPLGLLSHFALEDSYQAPTGPGGGAYLSNFSVSPTFDWSAVCTIRGPYLGPVNLSGPPPFTGSGCGYSESWSISFDENGSVNASGPFFGESDGSGGGPRAPSTGLPSSGGAGTPAGTWIFTVLGTLAAAGTGGGLAWAKLTRRRLPPAAGT